jgi:hypothetical protein
MSLLNLLPVAGRIYCRECLCQIPATYLACPACAGYVKDSFGRWIMPAASPKNQAESAEEQTPLFSAQEYPE